MPSGCGTTRMYGFGDSHSPNSSFASSLETEPAIITFSPCCQLTGLAAKDERAAPFLDPVDEREELGQFSIASEEHPRGGDSLRIRPGGTDAHPTSSTFSTAIPTSNVREFACVVTTRSRLTRPAIRPSRS
jgi:hypothetical protein